MAVHLIDDDVFKADLTALIPQMRAFARSLARNVTLAEDVAQDALAKAWASRASFEPGTNLKAWTFMIVRNEFLSHCRRSWRSCSLDQTVAETTLVAVTNPDGSLELDDLRRAMNMLPLDQREALILIGAAGLSYEEAAEICDTAIGTIKSRVSRARTRLAEILAGGEIAEDGIGPRDAMAAIFSQADALRTRAGSALAA